MQCILKLNHSTFRAMFSNIQDTLRELLGEVVWREYKNTHFFKQGCIYAEEGGKIQ